MDSYSSEKHQKAIKALKKSGLKVTKAREAVIDTFCQSNRPLNHKDIYQRISEKGTSSADLTSVYRTIEIFKKNNLIHEIQGEGYLLCLHRECGSQAHLLTFCTNCKSSKEVHIPDPIFSPIQWYLRERMHFLPSEHHIQIEGFCKLCQTL
ncbi:MAG: Fur family transcriptional regulator [Oligoflexales bacterium]